MPLDAIEAPEEIKMPPGTTELAVGGGLEPNLFLLANDALDLAIFHGLEIGRGNFTLGAFRARLFQGCRAEQAAHMVGAERRPGAFHRPHTSSATSTIRRSFAHCSSAAITLPSSVEAKPHCGDSANWSSGTNFAASSMRRRSASFD